MKAIVGLGNPGPKYAGTRHNIGFEVIDYLAAAPGIGPFRSRFQALVTETQEQGEAVLLVKPETFMNLSGRAVRQLLDFYKLRPTDLLIVSDDFNLPLGKLRVRGQGSHGGQNGLRDIQQQLGTDAYPRLRVGVGQPGPGEAVDFVLSRFRPTERKAVDDAVARAASAVLTFVRRGLEACMNEANGPAESGSGKKPKPTGPRPDDKKTKKLSTDEEPPTTSPRRTDD